MAATRQQRVDFVFHLTPLAKKAGGGPLLGILAQAALESGWGLSAPGNMLFGVKAGKAWKGKRQLLRTWEASGGDRPSLQVGESVIRHYLPGEEGNPFGSSHAWRIMAWFKAFDSPLGSFEDHATLMRTNRYSRAAGVADPRQWSRKVKESGYATDPGYVAKMDKAISEIESIVKALASRSERPSSKSPWPQAGSFNPLPLLALGIIAGGALIYYKHQGNARHQRSTGT